MQEQVLTSGLKLSAVLLLARECGLLNLIPIYTSSSFECRLSTFTNADMLARESLSLNNL